jgi:hypothetical protein
MVESQPASVPSVHLSSSTSKSANERLFSFAGNVIKIISRDLTSFLNLLASHRRNGSGLCSPVSLVSLELRPMFGILPWSKDADSVLWKIVRDSVDMYPTATLSPVISRV